MADRIEMEVEIQYCLTLKIWADLLNEPKQGAEFKLDGAMIMNFPIEYNNEVKHLATDLIILDF